MELWQVLVLLVIVALVAGLAAWFLGSANQKSHYKKTTGSAEELAKKIIEEGKQAAETSKREALLEAKEENLKAKNELEQEAKERRAEISKLEKRVLGKEEAADRKLETLERREQSLTQKEENLKKKHAQVDELRESCQQELERVSGLSPEEAKQILLKSVEADLKSDMARMIKDFDAQAKEEATRKAREYIVSAIQKCATDCVAEATISVVQLPNEEMKGRIIGREGRNIRTLETITGVDLIVDDTPEAVVLSSFEPVRREVARIALEKLITDGRIHPARIEEMVEKAQKEVDETIREAGESAVYELGLHNVHPEIVRLLGRMKYRYSYGQNALRHSIEVALIAGNLAASLGQDVRLAKRAGLLHDIGKAIDREMEGTHVELGAMIAKKYKEHPVVLNAIESHHGEVEATSIISCIVQAADAISAARPGARRETLENYTTRLTQLEELTNSFEGVDKSFAIQAGREIRVMVTPDKVTDDDMVILARNIAKRIEEELQYPGNIKVNMIRESRVVDYAK